MEPSSKCQPNIRDKSQSYLEKSESEPITRESSKDSFKSPQLFHYGQKLHRIMEKMGYNLTKRSGLKFGKGRRALLRSFVVKNQAPDY